MLWSRVTKLGVVDLLAASTALLLVIGTIIVPESGGQQSLPLQFRVERTALSDLPVVVSDLRSCGCWSGPRDQAVKKFKFALENRGANKLSIGGGETSAVRLLVAYPKEIKPKVTFPDESSVDDKYISVASPSDTSVWHASRSRLAHVSYIENGRELFAVPEDFEVWAVPPVPNYVVEQQSDRVMTFPTIIDQGDLLPGEKFSDSRLGHGAWVFFMPLQREFIEKNLAVTHGIAFRDWMWIPRPRTTTKDTAPFFRILGVGLFSQNPSLDLIGFAPAPSDDELADPEDL